MRDQRLELVAALVTTPTASTTGISSAARRRKSLVLALSREVLGQLLDGRRSSSRGPSYATKRTTWRWMPRTTSTSRSTPLREWLVPGQVEEVGMARARDQLHSRGSTVPDRRVVVGVDPAGALDDLVLELRFGAEVRSIATPLRERSPESRSGRTFATALSSISQWE